MALDPPSGRLHPAVADVRRAVRTSLHDHEPGRPVVVACSGGTDSMALASAAAFEGRATGWLTRAAVVDHGLQDDSHEVARVVAERCRALGLQADVLRVQVGTEGGPEAAARAARYAALEEGAASDGAVVLLGHTRDDQAETVLLGLARGSGLRSLAGMAPVHGRLRRPLLDLERAVTELACAAEQLPVWHDPHNDDLRYARVRVRRQALPALEAALGPGVAAALARTATAARHDSDVLDTVAAELVQRLRSPAGGLFVDGLGNSPPALRRRALRSLALDAGAPPGRLFTVHVDAMERLVTGWRGQQSINLPAGVVAWRADDEIRCARTG